MTAMSLASSLSKRLAGAALAASVLLATPVSAGQLQLDFDLSASMLSVGDLVTASNANGTLVGKARLFIDGVTPKGRINGLDGRREFIGDPRFVLTGIRLDIGLNQSVSGATLTGSLLLFMPGPAFGGFDGRQLNVRPGSFGVDLRGTVNCLGGSACTQLGQSFPLDLNIANFFNGQMVLPLSLSGLDSTAMLNAVFRASRGGQSLVATFSGREVGRRFFPEPAEPALLLLGALGLGCAALLRRAPRRTSL